MGAEMLQRSLVATIMTQIEILTHLTVISPIHDGLLALSDRWKDMGFHTCENVSVVGVALNGQILRIS